MTKLIAILAILSASIALSSSLRVVCYFTSWTIYRPDNGKYQASNVDPHLCTHIIYAFVGLNEDGSVDVLDDWEITGLDEVNHLVGLKEENPDLMVLLGMGGWNEGSTKYSHVAADPAKRAVLVQSVLSYVGQHGFDGFDLDWEYPGQREGDENVDENDYVTLLGELKSALNDKGWILSADVSGGVASMDISYPDIRAVSNNLDMINVMAYDYHGSFETFVGHLAPLFASHLDETDEEKELNVASGIDKWLSGGADVGKINLGVGTYGRSFTLANQSNTDLYAPIVGGGTAGPYTRQDGILGYNEICSLDADWEYVWDDEQQVPHKISGNQWVGYEDARSLTLKVQYALDRYIDGIMVWSLDTDDFLGLCGDGPYPLLNAINGVQGKRK